MSNADKLEQERDHLDGMSHADLVARALELTIERNALRAELTKLRAHHTAEIAELEQQTLTDPERQALEDILEVTTATVVEVTGNRVAVEIEGPGSSAGSVELDYRVGHRISIAHVELDTTTLAGAL